METINVRNTHEASRLYRANTSDQSNRVSRAETYSHFFRNLLYVVLTIPLPMGSDDVALHL